MYIEGRFIPFSIWVMGGGPTELPPMPYASEKSPMLLRVNISRSGSGFFGRMRTRFMKKLGIRIRLFLRAVSFFIMESRIRFRSKSTRITNFVKLIFMRGISQLQSPNVIYVGLNLSCMNNLILTLEDDIVIIDTARDFLYPLLRGGCTPMNGNCSCFEKKKKQCYFLNRQSQSSHQRCGYGLLTESNPREKIRSGSSS